MILQNFRCFFCRMTFPGWVCAFRICVDPIPPPPHTRRRCGELAAGVQSINEDMAGYVGDVLVERSRRISGLGLTHRELEIIRLSAQGLTAAEIAEKLYLSVHTVNNHRQRIYAKMDVRNVSEMTRKATDLGILPD